jgi:hypothetical protein
MCLLLVNIPVLDLKSHSISQRASPSNLNRPTPDMRLNAWCHKGICGTQGQIRRFVDNKYVRYLVLKGIASALLSVVSLRRREESHSENS